MTSIVGFSIVLILSYVGVGGTRLLAERLEMLDVPNERSSHTHSVPRGGGLTIVILTLLGVWLYNLSYRIVDSRSLLAYTFGAALIVTISWLDDWRSQPAFLRFAMHGLGAVLAIYGFGSIQVSSLVGGHSFIAGIIGPLITFLWIVGLTNVYNFMDGIDGIAGGQAFVAGLGWTIVGLLSGNAFIMCFGLLISSSSLGFLLHNWSPARIFMGDVGSAFLGYTFAVLPLILGPTTGIRTNGLETVFVGGFLLWPFIFDSTFTLLRRLRLGENVFQAHRSHLYQRLVVLGYSHKSVSLAYSVLAMVGLAFVAGWAMNLKNISALIVIVLPLLCIALWGVVTRGEQKKARTHRAPVATFADPT